jgi:hypothetical protein
MLDRQMLDDQELSMKRNRAVRTIYIVYTYKSILQFPISDQQTVFENIIKYVERIVLIQLFYLEEVGR